MHAFFNTKKKIVNMVQIKTLPSLKGRPHLKKRKKNNLQKYNE